MTAGTGSTTRFYVAVRLWELIGRSGKTLSAIADELPLTLNTPELRLDCDEARKFAIVAEVAERLRRRGDEVIDIDGVRVKSLDGWWLVRASNTQAVIVARAEASTQAGLARLKEQIVRELSESGLCTRLD